MSKFENKAAVLVIALFVVAALVGIVSAVNSGDERGSAVLYENKYTDPAYHPAIEDVTGEMFLHSGTSALTHNVNNLDLWAPDVYLSNNKDAMHREMKVEIGQDGTYTARLVPGDFTVRYRYCLIPVKISAGQNTFIDMPECDR